MAEDWLRPHRPVTTFLLLAAGVLSVFAQSPVVDACLPGGNIVHVRTDGDVVHLRNDLRDTEDYWFYWAFRVCGTAGRTLTFHLDEQLEYKDYVAAHGACVSRDRGATWTYADREPFTTEQFTYTFAKDDDEVWFSMCLPYGEREWQAFLARHKGASALKVESLCASRHGRPVPLVRIGNVANPKHRVFLSSRHHCAEAPATYVLEGVLEAALADDGTGAWFRENVEIVSVPMVDYDGVVEGDQGKRRRPHDYNRDYTDFIWPETRAIRDLLSDGRRYDAFLDFHCPSALETHVHQMMRRSGANEEHQRQFGKLLAARAKGLVYDPACDYPWAGTYNASQYAKGLSSTLWAAKLPGMRLTSSIEIPFAETRNSRDEQPGALVTPENARAFGMSVAAALRAFLEEETTGLRLSGDPVVSDIFRRRVAERCADAEPAVGTGLAVSFVTDASLSGDDADVVVSNGTAVVRGARRRALVHGAGLLLRQMTWRDGTFSLPDGAWSFRPAVPLRQTYFARQCHNVYYMWTGEELSRYCEDLMLWGYNSVHVNFLTPLNFKSTYEDEPETRAFMDVYADMARRLREVDMLLEDNTMGNLGFLDAPERYLAVTNRCVERRLPDFGRRVCPNREGTLDYLVNCQKAVFAAMKKRGIELDIVRFWPYDEGGCGCDACDPWGGNGYVRVIDALTPVIRQAFPKAKTMASTWYFTQPDWRAFYGWLGKSPNRPDFVLADDYGGYPFPRYPVEHPLPSGTELVTFPETSMNGRYPWGAFGAVCYPNYIRGRYLQTKGRARGFCCYSEGIYEDLNKILACEIYTNPSNGFDGVCAQYARYELGLPDGARLAELVKILEANLSLERISFARAQRALDLAEEMEAQMDPVFRKCWRWRELFLRVVVDFEKSRPGGDLHTPASDAAFAELVAISKAEPRKGDYGDPLHRRTRPPSPGPEASAWGVRPFRGERGWRRTADGFAWTAPDTGTYSFRRTEDDVTPRRKLAKGEVVTFKGDVRPTAVRWDVSADGK